MSSNIFSEMTVASAMSVCSITKEIHRHQFLITGYFRLSGIALRFTTTESAIDRQHDAQIRHSQL